MFLNTDGLRAYPYHLLSPLYYIKEYSDTLLSFQSECNALSVCYELFK